MLALRLALRFLFFKRRETFISINALLAIGAVAFSVLVLLVVVAVMGGFGKLLREKILHMTPHILIYHDRPMGNPESLLAVAQSLPEVLAAAPYIQGHSILTYDNRLYGIGIRGMQLPEALQIIRLQTHLKLGRVETGRGEIVIGTELARQMNVGLGDTVVILAAGGFDESDLPDELPFRIVGLYESGLHDYDQTQTFMHLEDAKILYGFRDAVHGIEIAVRDPETVQDVKAELSLLLEGPLTFRTWLESNRAFFAALKAEKNVMFILLTFAVGIASMNILSTLVMLVMEKTRDIGILKAIGFSNASLLAIFLAQGTLIGVLGTLTGAGAGLLFIRHIDRLEGWVSRLTGYEVFPREVYAFDSIPVDLTHQDLGLIVVLALGVSILAAVYPAMKAARLRPVEAIRHE